MIVVFYLLFREESKPGTPIQGGVLTEIRESFMDEMGLCFIPCFPFL